MMKEKGKGVIIFIVILILIIIALISYILVSKNVVKIDNYPKEINEKKSINDKEETISIDVDNAYVKTLFSYAHPVSIGPSVKIFDEGGYNVSTMSLEEKISAISQEWLNLIFRYDNQGTMHYEIDEEALKNVVDRVYGPNTYQTVRYIKDLCITYYYNINTKKYVAETNGGCGGVSSFNAFEKIISATKYEDKIEIKSAVVFIDGNTEKIYKDYNKKESLGKVFDDDNAYYKYIDDNKDNLEQYVYTYNLNKDGFYYLNSVKRVTK